LIRHIFIDHLRHFIVDPLMELIILLGALVYLALINASKEHFDWFILQWRSVGQHGVHLPVAAIQHPLDFLFDRRGGLLVRPPAVAIGQPIELIDTVCIYIFMLVLCAKWNTIILDISNQFAY